MFVNSLPKLLVILLLLALAWTACERVTDTLPKADRAYYPIEVNKYRIYQVDSTVYDEYNCSVEQESYQIKEVTGASFTDGEGAMAHRIERYWRETAADNWTLVGVWSEKIEGNQIQRVEDNQRFVKMVFPVLETKDWNGIVFIRRDTLVPIQGGSIDLYKDWEQFTYENVGEPFLDPLSNTSYPEAVHILQVDKTNNIERRYAKEVYAKNIGLVYKEMRILDSQCRTPRCTGTSDIASCISTPWEFKAEKGFILKQSLLEHNY